MGQKPHTANKRKAAENQIIDKAIRILDSRMQRKERELFVNPSVVRQYLRLQLEGKERELFTVLFLDTKHRLIRCETLFFGSVDGCSVHPREVAKAALRHNAAAIILAHNHPSGIAEPSQSDIRITEKIKQCLVLFDIRVLDHFIIGENEITSFAERGLV